jgi:hypothetical protein
MTGTLLFQSFLTANGRYFSCGWRGFGLDFSVKDFFMSDKIPG